MDEGGFLKHIFEKYQEWRDKNHLPKLASIEDLKSRQEEAVIVKRAVHAILKREGYSGVAIGRILSMSESVHKTLKHYEETNSQWPQVQQFLNYYYMAKERLLLAVKVEPGGRLPQMPAEGDAGIDLYVRKIIMETPNQIVYDLGIRVEIPEGHVGLVFPRSSVRNYDLALANSVGVIDSGYRGIVQATFNKVMRIVSNIYEGQTCYAQGDKCAQLIVMPIPQVQIIEVDELTDTERGEGGHGSTGT